MRQACLLSGRGFVSHSPHNKKALTRSLQYPTKWAPSAIRAHLSCSLYDKKGGAAQTLNNWIEISADALTHNFQAIQATSGPETTVLAVIKANAYGHGAETCAPILVHAGATWLGVTCANEGARVRRTLEAEQLTADILIMSGFLPDDVPQIRQHGLTPVVWTEDHIRWLAGSPGIKVHLEVDTGMGRQGVEPGLPLDRLVESIVASGLLLDGIFTHFCSSEVAGSTLTVKQQKRFEGVLSALRRLAHKPTWVHAGNSSAVDGPADHVRWISALAHSLSARPLVRTGLALYGYCLPIENGGGPRLEPALTPVLTWKAHVLAVRTLTPGDTVGYNAIFTADRPMRVALLPAGYADGLRRELSSTNERPGGWAVIRGRRASILGRVSMNLTVVDITDLPNVAANDEAILLGPGITAEVHAELARTISYEILCGIHPCN